MMIDYEDREPSPATPLGVEIALAPVFALSAWFLIAPLVSAARWIASHF